MQLIAAIGQMHNVFPMQGVVGGRVADVTRSVIVVHAGLLGAQTVFVVFKGDLIVALSTEGTLVDATRLTTGSPGIVPGAVILGIANCIIGNGRTVERSQLVLPVGVTLGKGVSLHSSTNSASSKGIRSLTLDVTTLIIGIRPGGTRSICSGVIRVVHTDQLAQQIVLVRNGLAAVADTGDVTGIVIRIGQRDAGLGNGLHQRRGAARAVTAGQIAVGRSNTGAASIDSAAGDTAQTVIDLGGKSKPPAKPVVCTMPSRQ